MIPIITTIGSIITTWLTGYNERQQKKKELDLAELENKARLMRDKESYNHAWEMANLKDKDKYLRRLSFLMFSAPFVAAIFWPEHVHYYFVNIISVVPEWWQKTYVAITGGIWGISSLKNILPAAFDAIKKTSKLPKPFKDN